MKSFNIRLAVQARCRALRLSKNNRHGIGPKSSYCCLLGLHLITEGVSESHLKGCYLVTSEGLM